MIEDAERKGLIKPGETTLVRDRGIREGEGAVESRVATVPNAMAGMAPS